MRLYIKFLNPFDIFIFDPCFHLGPEGEYKHPLFCPFCGEHLYLAIELENGSSIIISGERTFNIIKSSIETEPKPKNLVLEVNRPLSTFAIDTLKNRRYTCYPQTIKWANNKGFGLNILGISEEHVEHICKEKENVRQSNCTCCSSS